MARADFKTVCTNRIGTTSKKKFFRDVVPIRLVHTVLKSARGSTGNELLATCQLTVHSIKDTRLNTDIAQDQ